VSQRYGRDSGNVAALEAVDLRVATGTLTAVVGPSGSGKSTLLRLLACVDRPTSGEVWIDGQRVDHLATRRRRKTRRRRLGYLFQRPADNLVPYLSVHDHVVLAARLRGATVDVAPLLDLVGLSGREDHLPAQLSGGEQQRAAVAAAVAGRPALVVADEPTAALDARNSDQLIDLFAELAARGTSLVVASHDESVIRRADAVVRLRDGRVV
jgi:ABC-type lipoprotein export system ATPase subunit